MEKLILASQLKELMKRNDCSLSDLARDTDIAPSTIHGWLNGLETKSIIKLKRISSYFGVTVDYLCFGEADEEESYISIIADIELKDVLEIGSYEVVLKIKNK